MKFYSSEPNTLREELTRYQFFLQLKQDVLEGKLHCPHQTAVQLAALALQCKLLLRKILLSTWINFLKIKTENLIRTELTSIKFCS